MSQRYSNEETEEFIALFNGKWSATGKTASYDATHKFLQRMFDEGGKFQLSECINLMVTINQAPIPFLFAGRTKSGKGDGNAIDERLAKLLPMLSDEDARSVNESLAARAKAGFKKAFIRVNVSMVRRIAMISTEYLDRSFSRSLEGYFNAWGAPSSLLNESSLSIVRIPSEETKEIKLQQLMSHQAEREYWNNERFRSIFDSL
jgi:hypothetical protein